MSRKFVVLVKEFEDGHPTLIVEPHEDLGLPDDKRVSIRFPKGTTYDQAQDLARILNKTASSIEVINW
ncbi:hypothetical protein SAMN05444141_11147 [Pseudovibrio denitrificans]|uniref:Uncharacterized protein n=1 Tax=Pseudovibrio denitrificans TaxID=258256 RepID=A0A1I7DV60_9HYPH|nr:hypothetical protein [Pseudovibrio denitrificans]SFU15545.1 hypothetical protein SAMN05444141_11147 [Pseudovibrio denitrificans]